MFKYVEDKEFLKSAYAICSDITNRTKTELAKEGMDIKVTLVGSGSRNMITQNAKEPIDFDFNFIITDYDGDLNDGQTIKELVKSQLDKVLKQVGWGDSKDSTSCLTTEKRNFKTGNKTPFSFDAAIVVISDNQWYRLIHEKTGFVQNDRWHWVPAPNSSKVWEKETVLKKTPKYWNEVRIKYLEKKNRILSLQDQHHPSFVCYIEAVNDIYHKYYR